MIYGVGAKGNFPRLARLATKVLIFPAWHNKRSMLYIDNLAEFVLQVVKPWFKRYLLSAKQRT